MVVKEQKGESIKKKIGRKIKGHSGKGRKRPASRTIRFAQRKRSKGKRRRTSRRK